MCVLNAHAAHLDSADAPRGIAQQHDVAREAFDGEVFIDCSHDYTLGFGDDRVIRRVGDRATGGDGSDASPTSRADSMIDPVVMEIRMPASAPRRNAFRQHPQNRIEVATVEFAIGIGAAHHVEKILFAPFFRCH